MDVRIMVVLGSNHGPSAISKKLAHTDDHLPMVLSCGNWHSRSPVHSGALTLSTCLLPWKSVSWGLSSVDTANFKLSPAETHQLSLHTQPMVGAHLHSKNYFLYTWWLWASSGLGKPMNFTPSSELQNTLGKKSEGQSLKGPLLPSCTLLGILHPWTVLLELSLPLITLLSKLNNSSN